MTFAQIILKEVSCPRCNAKAQHRLEDRDKYVIIYLSCRKCRLERKLGLTTRKALNLKKRQEKLRKRLSQAKSPGIRKQIEVEINQLERRIGKAELGI